MIDLECIVDYVVNIVKVIICFGEKEVVVSLYNLDEMFVVVNEMLYLVLEVYE